jgi:ParB-like chromosome segregation protein Spo0J
MQVIDIPLNQIKPYPNNPRKNAKAVDVVAHSISAYGFNSPIVVDRDMVIINGHTRYLAAQKLGLETVPVVVAAGLSPDRVKAYRIMDNRSASIAEWDNDKLLQEIVELLDADTFDLNVEFTGFSPDDLSKELGLKLGEEPKKKTKKGAENEVDGEIEFANELLEEHQYVVLYFDNTLDWQVAKEKLGLHSVRRNNTDAARDRKALGRVIPGKDVINRLKD